MLHLIYDRIGATEKAPPAGDGLVAAGLLHALGHLSARVDEVLARAEAIAKFI